MMCAACVRMSCASRRVLLLSCIAFAICGAFGAISPKKFGKTIDLFIFPPYLCRAKTKQRQRNNITQIELNT